MHSDAIVEADGVMFENNILSALKKVDTTTETAAILGRVWVRHLENLPLFQNLLTWVYTRVVHKKKIFSFPILDFFIVNNMEKYSHTQKISSKS